MWGKCVDAPDYLSDFLECAKKAIGTFYGKHVQQSPDYRKIINKTHFQD